MRNLLIIKLCIVLLAFTIIGCGSGSTSSNVKTGSITAQLDWKTARSSVGLHSTTAPAGVVTVRIIVSGQGMPAIQKDFDAAAGQGEIDGVPEGSNRTLTAQGLDANNKITHQGSKGGINVVAGLTTDVGTIEMFPVSATLTSITVTPSTPDVDIGSTLQFTATGLFSDGTSQNITPQVIWSSSNTALATIDSSGLATGVAAGTVTITAASGGISGTATLLVKVHGGGGSPTLTSISVIPSTPDVDIGSTLQFTATGLFSDGTSQNITSQVIWSSSNTAIATIDSNGLATGVSAGTVTITAASGGVSGTATLLVKEHGGGGGGGGPTLTSITVAPSNPSINVGATLQFAALGVLTDGTSQDVSSQVSWESDNTAVATISGSGLATGITAGTTKIKASANGIAGTTTLTVAAAAAPVLPAGVQLGNYSIDLTICIQTPQVIPCQTFKGISSIQNTDMSAFAQAVNASLTQFAASGQQSCTQPGGPTCSVTISNVSSSSWNNATLSFSVSFDFSITENGQTTAGSMTLTYTKIT